METFKDEYAAGLFDGEGSIYINKAQLSYGLRYSLSCTINNTHKPAMDTFHRTYGGAIQHVTPGKGNLGKRGVWRITLAHGAARDFLEKIVPHLFIKKDEALLAIAFQYHMDEYKNRFAGQGWRHPEYASVMAHREQVYLQLRTMKLYDWCASGEALHPTPEATIGLSIL